MAYGTPFLLQLGLSKSLMSLVWLAGPLSGNDDRHHFVLSCVRIECSSLPSKQLIDVLHLFALGTKAW